MTTPHYSVVIATPGHSMKSEYVKSLIKTCAHLDKLNLSYFFLNKYSSFVPTARELTALDSDRHDYSSNKIGGGKFTYDKIFWIDSDIEWEPEDFMKLYMSNLSVLSGLYQIDELGSLACQIPNKDGAPTRVNKVEFLLHDEPIQVGGVGFGFLAVKRGVFESIDRPWFLINRVQWAVDNPIKVNVGEDYSWCANAIRSGFQIWVDPLVKVKHHKETVWEV